MDFYLPKKLMLEDSTNHPYYPQGNCVRNLGFRDYVVSNIRRSVIT